MTSKFKRLEDIGKSSKALVGQKGSGSVGYILPLVFPDLFFLLIVA